MPHESQDLCFDKSSSYRSAWVGSSLFLFGQPAGLLKVIIKSSCQGQKTNFQTEQMPSPQNIFLEGEPAKYSLGNPIGCSFQSKYLFLCNLERGRDCGLFDTRSKVWKELPSPNVTREGADVCSLGNSIYIFFGVVDTWHKANTTINSIEKLDLDSTEPDWQTIVVN